MFKMMIPEMEYFNEEADMFVVDPPVVLDLEHSLISISKWEARWGKPFLGSEEKTDEEILDYIRCMSMSGKPVTDALLRRVTPESVVDLNRYIADPMTATWFTKSEAPPSRETITSEVIYYWMITLNIPFECQKWHLNRLLTLIRVCEQKNNPKKMSKAQLISQRKALNDARKARFGTGG